MVKLNRTNTEEKYGGKMEEDKYTKEELTIYNLYKTLKVLLDKIKEQSGRELENITIVYNQKLVEIGNKLKENNLTFSMATELTNTVNNKMMQYIKEASKALDEYVKTIENKEIEHKLQQKDHSRKGFLNRIFRKSDKSNEDKNNSMNNNIKENIALEKYDEMICSLKLFKIEKDIGKAIEEYIEVNNSKGKTFINNYKKNINEQLKKIGIKNTAL